MNIVPQEEEKVKCGTDTKKDWLFDLGLDRRGFFMVEAWTSTIPNRSFTRLRREQLIQLRNEINAALRNYPKPNRIALDPGPEKEECDLEECQEDVFRDGLCFDHFVEAETAAWDDEDADRRAVLEAVDYVWGDPVGEVAT